MLCWLAKRFKMAATWNNRAVRSLKASAPALVAVSASRKIWPIESTTIVRRGRSGVLCNNSGTLRRQLSRSSPVSMPLSRKILSNILWLSLAYLKDKTCISCFNITELDLRPFHTLDLSSHSSKKSQRHTALAVKRQVLVAAEVEGLLLYRYT